jgi:hypothetical protein
MIREGKYRLHNSRDSSNQTIMLEELKGSCKVMDRGLSIIFTDSRNTNGISQQNEVM